MQRKWVPPEYRGEPHQHRAPLEHFRIRDAQGRLTQCSAMPVGLGRRDYSDATALRDDPARRGAAWSAKKGV